MNIRTHSTEITHARTRTLSGGVDLGVRDDSRIVEAYEGGRRRLATIVGLDLDGLHGLDEGHGRPEEGQEYKAKERLHGVNCN